METAGRAVARCRDRSLPQATGAGAVRTRQQRRRRLRGGAAPAGGAVAGQARACSAARGDLRGDAAVGGGAVEGRGGDAVARPARGPTLVIDALFGAGLARRIEGIAARTDRAHQSRAPVGRRGRRAERPARRHGRGHGGRAARRAYGDLLPRQARPLFPRGPAPVRRSRRSSTSAFHRRFSTRSARGSGATSRRCGRDALRRGDPARPQIRARPSHDPRRCRATGAARLAAMAARRAGAGLADHRSPSAATRSIGWPSPATWSSTPTTARPSRMLLDDRRRNGLLIGPGSGVNERTRDAVLAVLGTSRAVVLDADAVTVFADDRSRLFSAIRGPVSAHAARR